MKMNPYYLSITSQPKWVNGIQFLGDDEHRIITWVFIVMNSWVLGLEKYNVEIANSFKKIKSTFFISSQKIFKIILLDGTIHTERRKRAILKEGAVPSIFKISDVPEVVLWRNRTWCEFSGNNFLLLFREGNIIFFRISEAKIDLLSSLA